MLKTFFEITAKHILIAYSILILILLTLKNFIFQVLKIIELWTPPLALIPLTQDFSGTERIFKRLFMWELLAPLVDTTLALVSKGGDY